MITPALAQREVALAGVALLAAVVSLALAGPRSAGSSSAPLPEPVPAAGGGWYEGLAAARNTFGRRPTACGFRVQPNTLGVGHPVLPCGAKLYVALGDIQVLTQVIARGPSSPGRQFDLTPALAGKLGLEGVERIRWRFARLAAGAAGVVGYSERVLDPVRVSAHSM